MVRKFLKIFVFINTFLLLIFNSCQKAPINGKLDGRWQIVIIENCGEIRFEKERQLYYNFYNSVCNLSFYGGVFIDGIMKYENSELYLFFPNINTPVKLERLEDFGIYSNPVTFKVEYLDSKKLILKEGDEIITLRKF